MGALTEAVVAMENVEQPETLDQLIADRARLHGDFTNTSTCDQRLKDDFRAWVPNWQSMQPYQRTALDMIAQKIARILTGDPNETDHWKDIEGYARMVRMRLEQGRR